MEESIENENISLTKNQMFVIYLNDVPMKKMLKDYFTLEIESNKVSKNEKERMKMNLQKLHVQRIK
jgi:predicted O-linked N-acetylglucosamine transferase (SPINDLY family)